MRNGEIKLVKGAWDYDANAWVSEVLYLTGNSFLEITLPNKGRVVIKKSENPDGPFPKALISNWSGPSFIIPIHGTTKGRYIVVCLTETPTNIQISSI